MRVARAWSCLALSALLGAGCVYGDHVVRLRDPPRDEASGVPPVARWTVSLAPVRDVRGLPTGVLYELHSVLGNHSGNLLTPDDIPAWVSRVLRVELEREGCKVVEAAPGIPAVGAEVLGLDPRAGEGRVRATFRAWIDTDGARRAEAVFRGEARVGYAFSHEPFVDAMARALQAAARQIALEARMWATVLAPSAAGSPSAESTRGAR